MIPVPPLVFLSTEFKLGVEHSCFWRAQVLRLMALDQRPDRTRWSPLRYWFTPAPWPVPGAGTAGAGGA
jgi:hypothetical protein